MAAERENSVEPGRNRGTECHAVEAERADVGRGIPGEDGRFLIWPKDTEAETNWKVDNRRAVKLVRE